MIKRFITAVVVVGCLGNLGTAVFAQEVSTDTVANLSTKTSTSISNNIEPWDLYQYYWRIAKVSKYSSGFDDWRFGPSAQGSGRLSINEGSSISRAYTTTVSGGYTIGKTAIGAELGVTIDERKTYETSYQIDIAEGEEKTIIFRPKYLKWKVDSEYVRVNNATGKVEVLDKETAYVKTFVDWDYDWKPGRLTEI